MSKGELVGIDFDKTLTDPEQDEWAEAYEQEPNPEMVEKAREIYYSGYKVVIWTARQWPEAPQIAGWLQAHEVPFHGIRCGKGGADAYIDDKAIHPDDVDEEF